MVELQMGELEIADEVIEFFHGGGRPLRTEHHEFHVLDHYTAYCLCGWTATTEAPKPTPQSLFHERPIRLESIVMLSEQYREHLR